MKIPKDLASMAQFIASPECKNIIILTGAGISVASGIPDFRSPGGMYDTLEPHLITATPSQRLAMEQDPTSVVEKSMFMSNSFPYLEVRRPFILGTREKKWKATIAHRFAESLHSRTGKLCRVYTQNIDGLYRQCTKMPLDKLVEVHGTIGDVSCESCGKTANSDDFCDEVKISIKDIYKIDQDAPVDSKPILCKHCGRATVKPTTVLFGSSLPRVFFDRATEDLPIVDLLIIAGTSLVVSPANSIAYNIPDDALRMIVNMEPVGQELGIMYGEKSKRDFFAQGPCDEVFLELMDHLDWLDDLELIADDLPQNSVKKLRDLRK